MEVSNKTIKGLWISEDLIVPIPAPVNMMSEKKYKKYKKQIDSCIWVNPYMLWDVNNVKSR